LFFFLQYPFHAVETYTRPHTGCGNTYHRQDVLCNSGYVLMQSVRPRYGGYYDN